MKNKSEKTKIIDFKAHLLHIMIAVALLVLSLVVIVTDAIKPTEDLKIPLLRNECLELDGWYDLLKKEKIETTSIEVQAGELMIIEHVLPQNLGDGRFLGFYDSKMTVSVYVGGGMVDVTGDFKEGSGYSAWRRVPLADRMSGETLTLYIQNNTDMQNSFELQKIYVLTGNEMALVVMSKEIVRALIVVACFISAVYLFVMALTMARLNKGKNARLLSTVAFLSVLVLLWIVSEGDFLQIFTTNNILKHDLSTMAFLIIPIFLCNYYDMSLSEGKKIYRILKAVYGITIGLSMLLSLFGTAKLTDMLFLAYIFIFTIIFYSTWLALKFYKRVRSKESRGILISLAVLLVFFVGALTRLLGRMGSNVSEIVGIGYVAFLVDVLVTQGMEIIKDYRGTIKKAEFKRMNAVDSVTQGNSKQVIADRILDNSIYEKGNPWFVHMDLIDFASINAAYGWEKGNDILRDLYKNNEKILNENETEASIRGSNFVFIIEADRDVDEFCTALSKGLSDYLIAESEMISLKARYSALRVQKTESVEDLLDCAVLAYSSPVAKHNPDTDVYYYSEECRSEQKQQYTKQKRIEVGLEKGEFFPYYQPVVNPFTGRVDGAEALVRWMSPFDGLIEPKDFISTAEATGQIMKIDLCIFKHVCEYLADRRRRGLRDIKCSVNLSYKTITSEEAIVQYANIIEKTKAPADLIVFEMTEASAGVEKNYLKKCIKEVHFLGAKVALDDFGSAFSNVATIGELNYDIIKPDRSLISNGFPEVKRAASIVSHVIDMFHELDTIIVCEGVENEKQQEALKELGCDYVQGYYYSKPLTQDEFEKYEEAGIVKIV